MQLRVKKTVITLTLIKTRWTHLKKSPRKRPNSKKSRKSSNIVFKNLSRIPTTQTVSQSQMGTIRGGFTIPMTMSF